VRRVARTGRTVRRRSGRSGQPRWARQMSGPRLFGNRSQFRPAQGSTAAPPDPYYVGGPGRGAAVGRLTAARRRGRGGAAGPRLTYVTFRGLSWRSVRAGPRSGRGHRGPQAGPRWAAGAAPYLYGV